MDNEISPIVMTDGTTRQGLRYALEMSHTTLIRGFRLYDGSIPILTRAGDETFLLPPDIADEESAVLLAMASAGLPPAHCDRIWTELYVPEAIDWTDVF